MKTFLSGALVALSVASVADAAPAQTAERVRLFASCAGRLSATIEHGWLTNIGDGRTEQRQRRGFEDLIAAILPDAHAAGLDGPRILHQRIAAKFAQAQLLHTASFHRDTRRAAHARELAERELARCTAILPR
ncbi:hypothetical protein KUV62_16120 [Salipiger bermudensis]|uniref:hypothetical protein n=1 Tax=Salipiger bermudensis TaxID=344736 RepID=UPI001C99A104|nr:hypothetical protein [Salipiger bermudensis]MBY6005452.1 hypothetical protein [Salipiger bermudensis]